MAGNTSTLQQYRSSIAAVSSGKEANEEAWMTMWCSSNWAELLQPAPLSISLLGSVLCIASGTDDFSLQTPPSEGGSQLTWKYVKHPDSFKTCLMQMVGDGYTAFETAHTKMQTIQALSEQMPDVIRNLVTVLATGTQVEVEAFFKTGLNDLGSLARKCEDAANACVTGFDDLSNLSQELSVACTYRAGTAEQTIVANDMHLKVLAEEKRRREEDLIVTKEAMDISRKSFDDAQDLFKDAVKSMPSGWSLMGMRLVEGFVDVVSSAASIVTLGHSISKISSIVTLGHGNSTSSSERKRGSERAEQKLSTLSTPENMTDPGTQRAPLIAVHVSSLKNLLYNQEEGHASEPDWAQLSTADGHNGGIYLKDAFQVSRNFLDPSKPISISLLRILDTCTPVLDDLIATTRSAQFNALLSRIPNHRAVIDKADADVKHLCQIASFAAQVPGTTASGLAYPSTPQLSGKASEVALQSAQYKIEMTRANLASSRDAFYSVSQQRQKQQSEITKTILEMTQLDLANLSVKEIIPILRKAMASFNLLRARFSQLAQFFRSITSLVTDIMVPSTERLVDALTQGEKMVLSGVSLGDFTRDLIYRQCMAPLKVALLTNKVSNIYVRVSTEHILPAQRQVAEMLEFSDNTVEGRKTLMANLTLKQKELERQATRQSDQILALIERDQQQFRTAIDARLAKFTSVIQTVYPAITSSAPASIQMITDAHVADVSAARFDEYSDALFEATVATGNGARINDLM